MIEHFWQQIPGFFTFPQYYSHIASLADKTWHGVEVGAYEGQSAAYLATELANLPAASWSEVFPVVPVPQYPRLDLVDNFGWNPAAVDRVRSALAPVAHVIGELVMGDSSGSAAKYPNAADGEGLDFVFIDADHGYSSVKADIAAWLPKVRSGGIIAGHDFAVDFPGVCQAVAEAFDRWECWRGERWGDQRMLATGQYYSVWSVEVP